MLFMTIHNWTTSKMCNLVTLSLTHTWNWTESKSGLKNSESQLKVKKLQKETSCTSKCPSTSPSNSDPSSWDEFDYLLTFKLHKYSKGIHVCTHAWINIQDYVFSVLFSFISLSTACACSELPQNAFTHPTGFQNDSPLFASHSYSTEVWCKILTSPAHFKRFDANTSANAG